VGRSFGPSRKPVESGTKAFCDANMMHLMGPLREPDQQNQDFIDEFHVRRFVKQSRYIDPDTSGEEQYGKVGSACEELEAISGIEPSCVDFILSLLVVDPAKRPSVRRHFNICGCKRLLLILTIMLIDVARLGLRSG